MRARRTRTVDTSCEHSNVWSKIVLFDLSEVLECSECGPLSWQFRGLNERNNRSNIVVDQTKTCVWPWKQVYDDQVYDQHLTCSITMEIGRAPLTAVVQSCALFVVMPCRVFMPHSLFHVRTNSYTPWQPSMAWCPTFTVGTRRTREGDYFLDGNLTDFSGLVCLVKCGNATYSSAQEAAFYQPWRKHLK